MPRPRPRGLASLVALLLALGGSSGAAHLRGGPPRATLRDAAGDVAAADAAAARAALALVDAGVLSPLSRAVEGPAGGALRGRGGSSSSSTGGIAGAPSAGVISSSDSGGGGGVDAIATVFTEEGLEALRARGAAAAASALREAAAAADLAAAPPPPPPPARADRGVPFDPARARLLATLQSIAYCSDPDAVADWTCTRCASVPGFIPRVVHFDAAWDLSGFAGYLPSLDAKVVVFRGTDSSSLTNWAENMRAWRTDAAYPMPGAPRAMRIHSGFMVMWNASSMAATFKDAYARLLAAHPRGPTFVLGHSMGGALAHLAAMDLRLAFDPPDLRVYTFGAPRVGNAAFSQFFDAHVAEAWRFTHGRDIVPSVPPTMLGFHHSSREVWLVDVDPSKGGPPPGAPDERVIICDDSGEDPSCHNSACTLGLCTSVADHLTYLDAHMYAGTEC
ncbi:alpha beta-hydrolase [Raphidocelis subcapitata]|uniref:Alpha beta-hydrolase n=1 Tax=Raphidocelis subcapitata TaxID=307507 RepID=A0A2V0P2N5_9CHLO|nr:alpha beta-hydrolase [Raphidocelis subcapitata]|eukprot:GBF94141.1 alpha beta-hydrolase [Raphidocelis subcapitata]